MLANLSETRVNKIEQTRNMQLGIAPICLLSEFYIGWTVLVGLTKQAVGLVNFIENAQKKEISLRKRLSIVMTRLAEWPSVSMRCSVSFTLLSDSLLKDLFKAPCMLGQFSFISDISAIKNF